MAFAPESEVLRLLGWTLLHSLWQGPLIGAIAWVALLVLRGASPFSRHTFATITLGVLLFMPVATAFHLGTGARPVQPSFATVVSGTDGAALQTTAIPDWNVDSGKFASPIPQSYSGNSGISGLTAFPGVVESALPIVVILWLIGVVGFGARLLHDIFCALRLRREQVLRPAVQLENAIGRVAGLLGLPRTVSIAVSARINGPAIVGFLRPVLLIPMSLTTRLTSVQVDLLLAHELAHIRRRDHLVNGTQLVGEVLMFFNPAVWWISRLIREEREKCCDAIAAHRLGEPTELARALFILAEHQRQAPPRFAIAARSGALLARIEVLVAPTPWRKATGAVGVAAFALAMAALWGATIPPAIRLLAPTPTDVTRSEPATSRAITNGGETNNGITMPTMSTPTTATTHGSSPSSVATTPAISSPEREILWAGPMPSRAWLRIRNLTGAVRVAGTTEGTAHVSVARKMGSAAGELTFRILRDSTRGDVVVCVVRPLHGNCDENGSIWQGDEAERLRATVDIVVTVPSGVNVEAATFEGDLRVTGTMANVEARTGRGHIGATLVSGNDRSIDLRTGDGDIELELPNGMGGELSARLSSGRLITDGLLDNASSLASQRFHARFGAGDSRIEGASGRGNFIVRRSPNDSHRSSGM